MAWIETQSPSFAARHESGDAQAAGQVLERLEEFREEIGSRFPVLPDEVTAIVHPGLWQLALAHPWLPLARWCAAPASRRYFAGWFSLREIHVLAPAALESQASGAPGSREALELAPLHEYAHLVVAANNPGLPPPFGVRGFPRYLRWAWLVEGAATWFSGQVPHLRAAVARRLREGGKPDFPPSARDALVLGGTVYGLLDRAVGAQACVALASSLDDRGDRAVIERAFELPFLEVEAAWREHLTAFAAGRERARRRLS
jgi:hypothetical protein